MMIYAPRALRHFSMAASEARAHRVEVPARPRPVEVQPSDVRPGPVLPVRSRTVVRLWLPLTAIFLVLSPFAILLSPLIYFAPPPYGYRPFATVMAIGRLLMSLGGTVVDIDSRDALVRIRIF
jgi:hypothetical protein